MLEQYVPVIIKGVVLGIARGLNGFAGHKKEDPKESFNAIKYLKSVAVCAGIGIAAELLLPYLPIEKNIIVDLITGYVVPWVGTDVVEDIFK